MPAAAFPNIARRSAGKQINVKPVSAKRVEDIDAGKEAPNKGRAIVPINDRLYDLLVEAKEAALSPYVIELNGEPIKSIKKGFAAASERSGVKCTPLMLRHSAAVWMAEARVPMGEIAAFLVIKTFGSPLESTRVIIRTICRTLPRR